MGWEWNELNEQVECEAMHADTSVGLPGDSLSRSEI